MNRTLLHRISALLLLCCLTILPAFAGGKAASDLETIRSRVIAELMAAPVNEGHVRDLLATLRADGTWPGINYQDVSNTGFEHGRHLSAMVEMARAYKAKGTRLRGDATLKKAIDKSLEYWLAHDFICDNWWWNQIGTPNQLISLLLIMDKSLTPGQAARALPMIGRAHLNATGARPSGDRIKIAGILAKSLLFNRDEAKFGEVIKVIEGEIKFVTGRGMQYDFSFHHREDRVNNTISYGMGYAEAFAEWAALTAGTHYQLSEPALHLLTDYYLDGICRMLIRGSQPDPGAMNRDITRADGERMISADAPLRLMQASAYRKDELERIVRARRGEASVPRSFAAFFWQSDHFTYQRPGFFTSVRMYSDRECNMEQPYNGEGLLNHHRGDGTNYLSRTGDEYYDLTPVCDWQMIPGTTVVQKPSLPSEKEIQKWGITDFAGATTDGLYGVAAFDFRSPQDPLQAKKSWFFFDREYVCLGAGIRSQSEYPVATTMQQCLMKSYVTALTAKGKTIIDRGEQKLAGVSWIMHNGTAWIFPQPADISLSNKARNGSWFIANHQSDTPKEEVSREVFKLWFDHGVKPANAGYQYIVVPEATEKELEENPDRGIRILSNTEAIQAVCHTGLGICEIAFYRSGEVEISKNLKISIDSPGLVLVHFGGDKVKSLAVADPSRKLGRIHLAVTSSFDCKGPHFTVSRNDAKGLAEIAVDLPQGVYAGKSVVAGN